MKKVSILGFIFIIILFFASILKNNSAAMVSSQEKRSLPIYSVETEEKKVAISFNAAWGANDVYELLEILENNNIKSTFFMCGYWVDDYKKEVMDIFLAGHDLANHGNTHSHMNSMTTEEIKNDILSVHNKIKDLTGYEMNLFRPPYGEYNNNVVESAAEAGYYTIQWNVDSIDWKKLGTDEEVRQVLDNKNLRNGSIILFHVDAQYTPEALIKIIDGLKNEGYEIVPVSELIYKESYYLNHEGRQIKVHEN